MTEGPLQLDQASYFVQDELRAGKAPTMAAGGSGCSWPSYVTADAAEYFGLPLTHRHHGFTHRGLGTTRRSRQTRQPAPGGDRSRVTQTAEVVEHGAEAARRCRLILRAVPVGNGGERLHELQYFCLEKTG